MGAKVGRFWRNSGWVLSNLDVLSSYLSLCRVSCTIIFGQLSHVALGVAMAFTLVGGQSGQGFLCDTLKVGGTRWWGWVEMRSNKLVAGSQLGGKYKQEIVVLCHLRHRVHITTSGIGE